MKSLIAILFLFITTAVTAQRDYILTNGPLQATYTPSYPPVANAGAPQVIQLPTSSVTISGSGSYDVAGTIVSYAWVQVSGSGGVIFNPSAATTLVNSLPAGTHAYELTVTDNSGATARDTVVIVVNDAVVTLPVVNAGTDQNITLPTSSATLTGSATDADGIASYSWVKLTGSPALGSISSPNSAITDVTGLVEGTYDFKLAATDNTGATAIDIVRIVVAANPAVTSGDGKFQYVISTSGKYSAGVFKRDGTLVRTLWSNVTKTPGTYTDYWDGTDDYINRIINPDTAYVIKVQGGNLAYTFMGTIGNSSTNASGVSVLKGYYHCSKGMAFGSIHGYGVTGYDEGGPSVYKFLIATPNVKIPIYGPSIKTNDMNFVCTDDTTVFWGFFDPKNGNNTGVIGTNVSNDAEKSFSAGVLFPSINGRQFPYTISMMSQANSFITGLAVQKAGIYLFVARAGINQLQVLNKYTGAVVQTLVVTSPKSIAVKGNVLWITTPTAVTKYTIAANGTVTAAGVTLPGLVAPLSVSTSPTGDTIAVCDGSTSQQVKFYTSSGTAISTFGIAGGYQRSATVNNSKFYFTDNYTSTGQYSKLSYVSYQPDGSYWVNDCGNFRVQHYNSSNTFVNRIQSLGATYTCSIDNVNPNRVYCGMLEFDVNWPAGTWSLTKNWGGTITNAYNIKYGIYPVTFGNGRTYVLIPNGVRQELIEFSSSLDSIRYSGTFQSGKRLSPDGYLYGYNRGQIGGTTTINSYARIGYSGAGFPTFTTTATKLFTTPILTDMDANAYPRTGSTLVTSSGLVIMYDYSAAFVVVNNHITVPKPGKHLEAFRLGTNTRVWATGQGDHLNYLGAYPAPHRFENANGVNDFAGGGQWIVGRYILTSWHGEFYKTGQANFFNLLTDNGLPLGQFGTARDLHGHQVAYPMQSGNTLTPGMLLHADGNLYVFYNDESDHGGLGMIKVSGLASINEQNIPIAFPAAYVAPTLGYVDLLANLPFDDTLVTNTASWFRSPVSDTLVNKFTYNWQVKTSALLYDRRQSPDLFMQFAQPTARTYTVTRDLGTNNVTNDWKISGDIQFMMPGGTLNGQNNNMFIEVLDDAGKLCAQFYTDRDLSAYPTVSYRAYGNSTQLLSITSDSLAGSIQPFEIIYNAGASAGSRITFNYGGHTVSTAISDGTANGHKPKTFKIRFNSTGSTLNYPFKSDISELKLYKDIL